MSCQSFDEDEDTNQDDSVPMVDQWMERGYLLRKLRELERQDELDRMAYLEDTACATDGRSTTTADVGREIFDYSSYLEHQRYHDDLKHVDHRFIDFGSSSSRLLIEQDKSLGKGGFCWDAAHILGDYLATEQCLWKGSTVIELGCGTGLCGIMVAKTCPGVHVTLTDLPLLMTLVERNLARNFCASPSVGEAVECQREGSIIGNDYQSTVDSVSSGSTIRARVLEWSEDGSKDSTLNAESVGAKQFSPSYDFILAADVVASIYNPTALALTMYRLAHANTTVYMSFKERLSTVHRQFEHDLGDLFDIIEFFQPTNVRNQNPQVRILMAGAKRLNATKLS